MSKVIRKSERATGSAQAKKAQPIVKGPLKTKPIPPKPTAKVEPQTKTKLTQSQPRTTQKEEDRKKDEDEQDDELEDEPEDDEPKDELEDDEPEDELEDDEPEENDEEDGDKQEEDEDDTSSEPKVQPRNKAPWVEKLIEHDKKRFPVTSASTGSFAPTTQKRETLASKEIQNVNVSKQEESDEEDESTTDNEDDDKDSDDLGKDQNSLPSIKFDSREERWKKEETKKGAHLKKLLKQNKSIWEESTSSKEKIQSFVVVLAVAAEFTNKHNRQRAFDELYNVIQDVPRSWLTEIVYSKMSLLQYCVSLGIGFFFSRLVFLLDRFQLTTANFREVRAWWLEYTDMLGNTFLHTLASGINSMASPSYIQETLSFFNFIQVSPFWFGSMKEEFSAALQQRNRHGKTPAQLVSHPSYFNAIVVWNPQNPTMMQLKQDSALLQVNETLTKPSEETIASLQKVAEQGFPDEE